MPIGAENDLKGIVDLVKNRAFIYKDDLGKDIEETDIPSDMVDMAAEWRAKLMESVADAYDEVIHL